VIDAEGIALIDDIRKALLEYGQQTTSSSVKKKTRKVTSRIIWSPEEYIDDLDNIMATSKDMSEVVERARSLVRSAEEAALKSMTVLPDDTGHHMVQSRTGGDALTELDYRRTAPIISQLSEKHQMTFGNTTGPRGNLPPEMSLSNWSHKPDDRATGLERESGIGKNPNKLTTAHAKGTAGYANMKGVDLTSDQAIFQDLDTKVTEQVNQARVAARTDFPRQQFLREKSGVKGLYKGPVPKDLVLDPTTVRQSYLTLTNGAVNLRAVGMGALGGFLTSQDAMTKLRSGDVSGALQAGGTEAVVGEGISQVAQRVLPKVAANAGPILSGLAPATMAATPVQAIQKSDPQSAIMAAQQRGGKLEVGFGGLKFKLPELGLTEAVGGAIESFMKL